MKDVDNGKRTGATGVIGHYTQVVWAKTYEVGCGFMRSTHPKYGVEDVSIQWLWRSRNRLFVYFWGNEYF